MDKKGAPSEQQNRKILHARRRLSSGASNMSQALYPDMSIPKDKGIF